MAPPVYVSGGHLGDVYHALAVAHAAWTAGAERGVMCISNDVARFGGDGFSVPIRRTFLELQPILAHQEYLSEFFMHEAGTPFERSMADVVNLNGWRDNPAMGALDWIALLTDTYGVPLPLPRGGWIAPPPSVKRDPRVTEKIVIHRSAMRHNPRFPWETIVAHNRCVFVTCNVKEFEAFPWRSAPNVECIVAADLLEMLTLICSGKLFIGNQSSPAALAWALGVPLLTEVTAADAAFYMSPHISWFLDDAKQSTGGVRHLVRFDESHAQQELTLSVSVGEALDKLTILRIKEKFITDPTKLRNVTAEIDTILPHVARVLEDPLVHRQYRNLEEVNTVLWHRIDAQRAGGGGGDVIMKDNDARFLIKSKINRLSGSSLLEQKNFDGGTATYAVRGADDLASQRESIRTAAMYNERVFVCGPVALRPQCEAMFPDCWDITFSVVT